MRTQKLMWCNIMKLTKSKKVSILHYSIDKKWNSADCGILGKTKKKATWRNYWNNGVCDLRKRINSIRSRCKTSTLHPPITIWHISFLKIFTNKWIGTTTHNHTLINNLFTLINQKIKTYKITNLYDAAGSEENFRFQLSLQALLSLDLYELFLRLPYIFVIL